MTGERLAASDGSLRRRRLGLVLVGVVLDNPVDDSINCLTGGTHRDRIAPCKAIVSETMLPVCYRLEMSGAQQSVVWAVSVAA